MPQSRIPLRSRIPAPLAKLLGLALASILIISLVGYLWPAVLPFGVLELWQPKGTPLDWLAVGWPALAWIVGLTTFENLRRRHSWQELADAEKILVGGLMLSALAGFFEELLCRWLVFMAAIPLLVLANYGCSSVGLPLFEMLQVYVLGPVTNVLTLGLLSSWLTEPFNWSVGLAMLAANWMFMREHTDRGRFYAANSWFVGMFMFFVMSRFGLPAAMLLHFLFDALFYTTVFLVRVLQRQRAMVRWAELNSGKKIA